MEIEEGKLYRPRYETLEAKLTRAGKNTRYQTNIFEYGVKIMAAKIGKQLLTFEITATDKNGDPLL